MDKPIQSVDDTLCSSVCEHLARRLGLDFSQQRRPDLIRRMTAAVYELGDADVEACFQRLLGDRLSRREMEVVVSHLTVGETYFFRDPDIFAALQQHILPDLIGRRHENMRHIRIWSAGCSSGEEAYSIAMTLSRLLPDPGPRQLSVLATDINSHALTVARDGIYGHWSFRHPLSAWQEQCFIARPDGRRAVLPKFKALVSVAHLNLVEDCYPAIETNTNAMDVIFCRNVLMYFQPDKVQQVVERLAACLVDKGWLILSPVETSLINTPALTLQRLPGVLLYQKVSASSALPSPETAPLVFPPDFVGVADGTGAVASPETLAAPASPEVPVVAPPAALLPDEMAAQARQLANRGLLNESLEWCDRAIAGDKLNPSWSFLRASILLELGETAGAVLALQRTLYLDHDLVMAHFGLANLLLREGKQQQAHKHYRNAMGLLADYAAEQPLPEAEGITAGRLGEIIEASLLHEVIS